MSGVARPAAAIVAAVVLAASAACRAGTRVAAEAPAPADIVQQLADGREVRVGASARADLMLHGFVVDARASGHVVTGRLHCAAVDGEAWSTLPGLEFTGRLGLEVPAAPRGVLTLIVGDDQPLRLTAETADGRALPMAIDLLRSGPGGGEPPADFWLGDGNPWSAPGEVARVRIPARADRAQLVGVRLGRRAPRVLARLHEYAAGTRARVCAAPLDAAPVLAGAERQASISLDAGSQFGAGWYGVDRRHAAGPARWMARRGAVLVPSAVTGPVRLHIDASPAGAATTGLLVEVNGVPLPVAPLAAGRAQLSWEVPGTLWLAGTNEIRLEVPRAVDDTPGPDHRALGLALHALRIERPANP